MVSVAATHKHHLELTVSYSGEAEGMPSRMILKRYDPGHPHGWREGLLYRDVVPTMPDPPTPVCYDVSLIADSGQAHILLEDLSQTHFNIRPGHTRLLTPATFEPVLDTYARFHTYWWEHDTIGRADMLAPCGLGVSHEAKGEGHIRENERFFHDTALPKWIDAHGDDRTTSRQNTWERAISAWARLFEERTASGTALTLIQGDAHMGNVLMPHQEGRPVLIDWEGLTPGIGLWDLSRLLLCYQFPPGMRRELERVLLPRYQRQTEAAGIEGYGIDNCESDYRLCVLANLPHVLVWGDEVYMESTMAAFSDWDCEGLL